MLTHRTSGTRLHEIADGESFNSQPVSRADRLIRHGFDASIALACVTLLALALCAPL